MQRQFFKETITLLDLKDLDYFFTFGANYLKPPINQVNLMGVPHTHVHTHTCTQARVHAYTHAQCTHACMHTVEMCIILF